MKLWSKQTLKQDQEFGEDLLTVSEIAAMLKVPVSWVYERTRRSGTGQIPHLKLGKYLRFRRSAVEKWLKQLEQQVA
jgi:excisionase family DNA binding protein